ncbi:sumo e1-like activator enzyme fub2 [Vairimorpha apis BRL 01]|uniref:NEDD8-activating enzyme E1 catalytic subunit n=1 Tax=Vairimorpha apis BRL 01 TaxID=1037528 RepID=T0KXK5_9MICR|nr:sumo e1-like activator enzyme fub2 [Vairimorpha apis BRL 01]
MMKNVLIVGTGGIGCELVKLLYNSVQIKITLIDFDIIELTNLNRQFLFTSKDIKKYKAQIVADKIKYITNWDVNVIIDNIFNFNLDFFKQFDIVYNCLDNNETRTYVNTRCFLLKLKLVDGGSNGYLGQSCIFDYSKECFDCLPKQIPKNYNICTIRTIPTKFEHCVEFIKEIIIEKGEVFKVKNLKKFINKQILVQNGNKKLKVKYNSKIYSKN